MKNGFPKFAHSAKQGERGVQLISRVVQDEFGWLFRRNHQENDFGVDGHIDIITPEGLVTGKMLAVQIKYGRSFFKESNRWGY